MNSLTPIQNYDQKIDIIDNVNQDHTEELIAIAHTHQHTKISSAKTLDTYQEGVKTAIQSRDATAEETFIPFEIEGDLED